MVGTRFERTSWLPVPVLLGTIGICQTGSLLTGVKLSCRVRWSAPVQANEAGVAMQEVGAVETSHANSAAA
jgi:hypothetical protein